MFSKVLILHKKMKNFLVRSKLVKTEDCKNTKGVKFEVYTKIFAIS